MMIHPEKKKTIFRLFFFYIVVILCFVFTGRQLYRIQITRHEELLRKARDLYTVEKKEQAKKGQIYDYNGNLLVSNHFVKLIAFDPGEVESESERKKIATYLAFLLPGKTTAADLLKRMNLDRTTGKKIRYVVLVRDIEFAEATEIEKKIRGMRYKGLIFKTVNRRSYPKGKMLANILGINQLDAESTTPTSGIELVYQDEMTSEAARIRYERGADGRRINGTIYKAADGQDGSNVYLTIQEPIQAILEEETDRLFQESQAKAVYAVIADPFTGDILAITQRPTFDPNDRSTMKDPLARTNLISGAPYEPGSVMKPFVVTMALDDGVITPDTIIETDFGLGGWRYAGQRPITDTHIVGYATPLQILQHSSNIGTAKIAVMLGKERVYQLLRDFGFGQKTGLPIEPESPGLLRHPSKWDVLTISRIGYGHAIAVTPLQLLRAYCMLANGGYPVQLRLIDSLEDDVRGRVKMPYHIGKESIFKNPATHKEVIRMLKSVTNPGGTADGAAVPGFEAAGKTGTANKLAPGGGRYVTGKYYSSFCGFIPADNPRFVIVITCDEPMGSRRDGGKIAGPAFSRIAQRTLQYMDVPPDMTEDEWNAMRKEARKQAIRDGQKRERDRRAKLGLPPQ